MFTVTYRPPAVNAIAALHAVIPAAEDAMAAVLLAKSQELVPVETGALRDSGVTGRDAAGAVVAYGTPGEKTADYAVVQHERMDYNHPNGGQAKYLEVAMHSASEEISAAAHAVIEAVL